MAEVQKRVVELVDRLTSLRKLSLKSRSLYMARCLLRRCIV